MPAPFAPVLLTGGFSWPWAASPPSAGRRPGPSPRDGRRRRGGSGSRGWHTHPQCRGVPAPRGCRCGPGGASAAPGGSRCWRGGTRHTGRHRGSSWPRCRARSAWVGDPRPRPIVPDPRRKGKASSQQEGQGFRAASVTAWRSSGRAGLLLRHSYWAEDVYEHLAPLLGAARSSLDLTDRQMTFFVAQEISCNLDNPHYHGSARTQVGCVRSQVCSAARVSVEAQGSCQCLRRSGVSGCARILSVGQVVVNAGCSWGSGPGTLDPGYPAPISKLELCDRGGWQERLRRHAWPSAGRQVPPPRGRPDRDRQPRRRRRQQ